MASRKKGRRSLVGIPASPVVLTAQELDPDDDWVVNEENTNKDEGKNEGENASTMKQEEDNEEVKMLFVLVHGNNGDPQDWTHIRRELYNRFNSSALIMTSSSNAHSTHEGIEVGGRNLACEIAGFVNQAFQVGPRSLAKQRHNLFVKSDRFGVSSDGPLFDSPYAPPNPNRKHTEDVESEKDLYLINSARISSAFIEGGGKAIPITIIGHSLGGLYTRNTIGWLYYYGFFTMDSELLDDEPIRNPHAPLEPHGVFTLCTPHLGSRRPGGSWMKATWKTMVHTVLNHANGQTGIELLLEDHTEKTKSRSRIQGPASTEIPLLLAMTQPDSMYMRGLLTFKNRTLIGITHWDSLVPYCSAAVVGHNPYVFPARRSSFAVVGSYGFTGEHNLVIIPYQDLSLSTPMGPGESSVVPTTDLEIECESIYSEKGDSTLPVNIQPSASIVGIPRAGTEYYTDTNLVVEYHSDMLTNLQSIPWRRIDIQFPKGPFVHELPIQKIRSKPISAVFSTNPGYGFCKMLSDLLGVDMGQ